MVSDLNKPLKNFKEKQLNKSAGILDDYAVRKVVSTREGTIEKVPVNDSDIVNKKYVDDEIISDHTALSNIGTNTHAQIDTAITNSVAHIADNTQAHSDYMLNTGDTATGSYTFDTNTLYVDATNHRVGIGTTTPTNKLHLYQNADSGTHSLIIENPNAGAGVSSHTRYIAGSSDVYFGTDGSGTSTTRTNKAYIYNAGAGGVSLQAVNAAGTINFMTGADNAANIRATILANGNVGIGTTSPGGLLTISGTNQNSIWFRSSADAAGFIIGRSAFADNNNDFFIYDHSATAFRFNINSAGNVGIGTASPTSKLQVVGLTDYANNAAAVAGGLTAGAFYAETGTNPKKVCVVY